MSRFLLRQLNSVGMVRPNVTLNDFPSTDFALALAHSRDNRNRIICVSTYPPRRCGLATFAANTRRGILRTGFRAVDVLSLGDSDDTAGHKREVIGNWNDGLSASAAAEMCKDYSCVLLQHEFGIYPGIDGCSVVEFVEGLKAPLVSVLHTVMTNPSNRQRQIIESLGQRSAGLVTLTPSAQMRLVDHYDVDPTMVRVIAHGAEPNLGGSSRPHVRPTLLTWGLLGPGKGIEHAIHAIALLAARGMRVHYVVAGLTHPNVLAHEGEHYRESLLKLVSDLGLQGWVQFDNQYRDWESVYRLVRRADAVILPYDSREQTTSGVLVDALASGKPVIATAFPHALDVVDGRCGLVVPHENPEAIADAIQLLFTNSALRDTFVANCNVEAARHDWTVIGRQYNQLIDEVSGDRHQALT